MDRAKDWTIAHQGQETQKHRKRYGVRQLPTRAQTKVMKKGIDSVAATHSKTKIENR